LDSLNYMLEAEYNLNLADLYFQERNKDKQVVSLKLVKQLIELAIIEAEKELINQQVKKGGELL